MAQSQTATARDRRAAAGGEKAYGVAWTDMSIMPAK
jgi:uncharacterized membrane protein